MEDGDGILVKSLLDAFFFLKTMSQVLKESLVQLI